MCEPRKLNAEEWCVVLTSLAANLPPDHQRHVILIGGVAMALGYGSRRTTEDADVVMTPDVADEVLPAAEQIAAQNDLPLDWMNMRAWDAGLITAPSPHKTVLVTSSIVFEVPSTEHMLAMKLVRFAGDTDRKDAEILIKRLLPSFSHIEDLWAVLGGLVPPSKRAQARYHLDIFWEKIHEST